jgi:hypothetical protein
LAGPSTTQSSIGGLEETEDSSVPPAMLDGYRATLAGRSVPLASSRPMNFTRQRTFISPKQQKDGVLKAHVASVHFKCFRCFRGMFQVFHTDVLKVDRDVAFVTMVCIRMLQASVPNVSSIFLTYVASVFILMLHMFHAYVVSVLFRCCVCFAMGFKCFSVVF